MRSVSVWRVADRCAFGELWIDMRASRWLVQIGFSRAVNETEEAATSEGARHAVPTGAETGMPERAQHAVPLQRTPMRRAKSREAAQEFSPGWSRKGGTLGQRSYVDKP